MRKLIALFCMFLIVMLPLSSYEVLAQEKELAKAEKTTRTVGEEAKESNLGVKEPGEKFEDILIQVDSYQPKVLRAGLLEEQTTYVYASLIGIPTNPTITIPAIKSVDARPINISWSPAGKPSIKVGTPRYIPPAQGYISYRNLGYLAIPINKIPKEHDVPDEITIDMAARIGFDITGTLTIGKKDLSMPALKHAEWLSQREQYSFFDGFLRAEEINENNAVFFLYDNGGTMIQRPITISEGSTSGVLTTSAFGLAPGLQNAFDKFRIRLNKIRGLEDEVALIIQKPEAVIAKLVKGDSLYEGSDWFVQDIKVDKNGSVVQFANRAGRKPADPLKFTFKDGKITGEAGAVDNKEKEFDNALTKARASLINDPKSYLEDYANAVATYEKVIQEGNRIIDANEYGDIYEGGNAAANAQRQIYEIYKELKFVGKQIEAGETLLKDYQDVKDKNLIRDELNALGDRTTVKDRTQILPDVGGDITITVSNAFKAGELDKPKATLLVNGEEKDVNQDNVIDVGGVSYKVVGFENRRVKLQRLSKDGTPDGAPVSVGYERLDIKGTKDVLQLKKLDFKRIASVSVIPEPKQAYSDTNFTLHIPIEKRRVGLPLFSNSLDKEINKTAKLIAKLDKYIDQMQKLHKFWTNLCLITFATIFAKNLLSGITGASAGPLVRNKINGEWKQKYSDARASGYKGSFDQYVSNNSAEYNADYDRTKKILDEIGNNQYKNTPGSEGITDEEFKKDYYYSYRRAQEDPKNEILVKNYIGAGYRARQVKVDNEIETTQKVDWNQLGPENQQKYKSVMDSKAAFADQRKDDPNKYAALWDDKQTRIDILAAYRKQEISNTQKTYLDQANGEYKEDIKRVNADETKYTDYLSSLRQTQSQYVADTISTSDIDVKNGVYSYNGEKIEGKVAAGETVTINGNKVKIVSEDVTNYKHNGQLNVYDGGREKGMVQRVSLDATRYAEVKYGTGGRIEEIKIYERPVANGAMGGKSDKLVGDAPTVQATTKDDKLKSNINQLYGCVGGLNNELAKQQVRSGYNVQTSSSVGCGLGRYAISKAAQTETGPSCVDYMDPGDCKLLFNACDPVICPPSRCNLGGRWQVDNVVQSGIVGSVFLCAPNWIAAGGDVVLPVCLTGILAGLQNIKSILQGYNQCLKKSQLEDTSVGICDRLRSYYLCEILWREASALLNTKEGVLGLLVDQVSGASKGGGEYSKGSAAVDEAGGAIGYFTESYAKNVFAGYAGAGFSEAGVEICKAAIFGKAPKVGDLLNSVSRPESPPQFTAFFDATPYADVERIPQYLYTIFYHIYAGENEDLTYSVYLRGIPAPGQPILQPATITIPANKVIKAGQFGSENIDRVLPAGYSEICIVTTTKTFGTKQECGPGKVTTEFALDYLSEQYVKGQATKKISKESECVPESYSAIGVGEGVGAVAAPVAAVSTGLTQTGIIRTCAKESPGIGVDKAAWARVGECGNDKLGRDLGSCWLYKPSADRALQQEYSRDIVDKGLFAVSREVEAGGLDNALKAQTLDKEQSIAVIKASRSLGYDEALKEIKKVIEKSLDLDLVLIAKYELAKVYRTKGKVGLGENVADKSEGKEPKLKEVEVVSKLKEAYKESSDKNEVMSQLMVRIKTVSGKTTDFSKAKGAAGLKVPKNIDLSGVNSLEDFMFKIVGALPGTYQFNIQDNNILIIEKPSALIEGIS